MTTASLLKTEEYYDFETFKEFAISVAAEIPEKTRPLCDQVAIAAYIEPAQTRGGILRPEMAQKESRWQSNVGVIIAKGPTAFKYDGQYNFEGYKPDIGDVVHFLPSDSRGINYRGLFVRVMPCELIKMVLADEDAENIY